MLFRNNTQVLGARLESMRIWDQTIWRSLRYGGYLLRIEAEKAEVSPASSRVHVHLFPGAQSATTLPYIITGHSSVLFQG